MANRRHKLINAKRFRDGLTIGDTDDNVEIGYDDTTFELDFTSSAASGAPVLLTGADTITSAGSVLDIRGSDSFSYVVGRGTVSVAGSGGSSTSFWQLFDSSFSYGMNLYLTNAVSDTVYFDALATGSTLEVQNWADVYLRDGADLRLYDSTDTDYVSFNHDGTSFNIDASGTANIEVDGITFLKLNGDSSTWTRSQLAVGITSPSTQDATFTLYSSDFSQGAYLSTSESLDNKTNFGALGTGQTLRFNGWTQLDVEDGADFRIYDSTDTDYASFSHDGTDFNTDFSGTTDWNITNVEQVKLFDGCEFRIYDSTDTDYVAMSHDGTDFTYDYTTTTDVISSSATGDYTFDRPVKVGVFTDAGRPAAGTAGRIIFNSDDGQLNIDDGTNWTLPDGTTT